MTGITNYRGAETAHRERRADFGYVGELSGENAGELLRGDPELFNGYVSRETFLAMHDAVYTDRLDLVELLINHKLCEAGRALALAAEACRLDMVRHLYARYWDDILSSRFYPLSARLSKSQPLWISTQTMAVAIERGTFEFVKWLYESFSPHIDLFNTVDI
ncbi:hypothetical protein C6341_g12351 [Phytophthora cactorum]|nr:hypothetical protein C6341_g12351 [Phytophthora cactorum]